MDLLSDGYFWYYIIFTAVIVWTSIRVNDVSSEWFTSLEKPPLYAPPNLFVLMWTILYISMLVGIIIVTQCRTDKVKLAIFYTILMVVLLSWVLIFSQKMLLVAGFTILIALALAILMARLVRPTDKCSNKIPIFAFGLLSVWLFVASYYNWGIIYLNPYK